MFKLIRKTIYKLAFSLDKVLKREFKVVVLCYHDFKDNGWKFSIKIEEFKKQIDYLYQNYNFITPKQFEEYILNGTNIPNKSILLTFDDGLSGVKKVADYINSKEIKPIVFVISDRKNASKKELALNKCQFLTDLDIKKLLNMGWELGCHSATHRNILSLNEEDLIKETHGSINTLRKKFITPVNYYSHPRGRYSLAVLNLLKQSQIKLAFSMDDNLLKYGANPMVIARVGIDSTHSFDEFKAAFSPSSILFRKMVKKYIRL